MAKSFPNTGATVIDTVADLPAASADLEGVMMFQKDTNELKICNGSVWISMLDTDNKPLDAWTSYTPTVAQGATSNIAKTVGYAKYLIIGKTMFLRFRLMMSGTGTAGSAMTVSLPSGFTVPGDIVMLGHGYFSKSGTGGYHSEIVLPYPSTTTMAFQRTDIIPTSYVGADPNVAITTNDELLGNVITEIN